jgi:hypothetical protein
MAIISGSELWWRVGGASSARHEAVVKLLGRQSSPAGW